MFVSQTRRGVGRGDPRAPARAFLRDQPRGRALARRAEGRAAGRCADHQHEFRRGLQGSIGQSAYSAAKGGIASLTLVQAAELAPLRHHRECARARGAHADDRIGLRRQDARAGGRLRSPGSGQHRAASVVWLGSAGSRAVTRLRVRPRGRPHHAVQRLERWPDLRQGRALGASGGRPGRRAAAGGTPAAEESLGNLTAMQFAFTPEQEMIRDAAREFVAGHGSSDQLRAVLAGGQGYDPDAWRRTRSRAWLDWAGAAGSSRRRRAGRGRARDPAGGDGAAPVHVAVLRDQRPRSLAAGGMRAVRPAGALAAAARGRRVHCDCGAEPATAAGRPGGDRR